MIKYRRLILQELESMEREFILFLSSNGIEADKWDEIKETDITKANDMIDAFSNHVFDKITQEVQFLDLIDEYKVLCIQCHANKMTRLCLSNSAMDDIDMTAQLLDPDSELSPNLEIILDQMPYSEDGRDHDVFKLLNLGFVKSSGAHFKKISLQYASIHTSD